MAVRPQDDLFRYVNGEWLDTAEIPADQSMTGAFIVLRDEAELACRGLLEEAAKESEQRGHERSEARSRDRTEQSGAAQQQGEAGSTTRLIGDLYRSFMDTERVEELGLAPFADQLAAVDGIEDVEQFFGVLGALERQGIGGLFGLYVDTDPAQPDRYVVNLLQGGLGLPDESFYREEQYIPLVDAYREHVSTLLDLGGRGSDGALTVFAVDREVAAQHWDRVRSRDRDQTNNPRTRAELDELLPAAWWSAWLAGIQAPENVLDEVIVRQPSFFAALPDLFTADRLADWKVWLSWRVLHSVAPYGPQALVDENFSFYGRTLSGTPELRERWKRGVGFVEGAAGEALGERYVAKYFPPAAKQRMDELVDYLVAAYRQEIGQLSWMSDVTKARALDKLDGVHPQGRLSAEMAGLLGAGRRRGGPGRQRPPGHRLRGRPGVRQDRLAGGPRRVVHDAADGERVLQPGDERDRLPGGDPADAVLRQGRRRRGELRRHRRGHRSRDRSRLRRPGFQGGRHRRTGRLVDR